MPQLCQRLAKNNSLRADTDELTESYVAYEDLALELLDAVREDLAPQPHPAPLSLTPHPSPSPLTPHPHP